MQALVAGSLAPAQLAQTDSSPGHAHLRALLAQVTQERDACQARLDQLQVSLLSCSQGIMSTASLPTAAAAAAAAVAIVVAVAATELAGWRSVAILL